MREIWIDGGEIGTLDATSLAGGCGPVGIAYLRVSSPTQVDDGNSLQMQESYLRRKCLEMFGDSCTIIWVADAGVSGRRPYWKPGRNRNKCRRGLTAVSQLIETGEIDFVMVYKCNRLARSLRVWLEFSREHLEKYGVRFISASECYESSKPTDKMLIAVLMVFAEMEVDGTRQMVSDSIRKRKADGYVVRPAFGWRWQDRRRLERGKRQNIERDPVSWKIVRMIFDRCIAGVSSAEIARELMDAGIPTATGKREWIPRDIRNILLKPVHRGLTVDPEGQLIRGQHYAERIVEESEFLRVQEVLASEKRGPGCSYLSDEEKFCRDLIRCAWCASKIGARLVTSTSESRPVFACYGDVPGKKHAFFSVRASEVISRISLALREFSRSEAVLKTAAESAGAGTARQLERMRKDEKRLVKALKNKSDLFAYQAQQALGGQGTDVKLNAARDTYRAEKAELEAELSSVKADIERALSQQRHAAPAAEALRGLAQLWDAMDISKRIQLIECLVEDVTLEPTQTHVLLTLKLIFSEPVSYQIYVHRKSCKSKTLDGATAAQLTTAYYILQGLCMAQIAKIEGTGLGNLYTHKAALLRRAGTKDVDAMLRMVAPVVEERKHELLLGARGKPERRRPLTQMEERVVRLIASGVTRSKIMESLDISRQAFRTITTRIYDLWQVRNMSDLRDEARQRGYASIEKGDEDEH